MRLCVSTNFSFIRGEINMRIATYNIWNSDAGMPMRFRQLIDEIVGADTDILCLQ